MERAGKRGFELVCLSASGSLSVSIAPSISSTHSVRLSCTIVLASGMPDLVRIEDDPVMSRPGTCAGCRPTVGNTVGSYAQPGSRPEAHLERECFIDSLLVRIHFLIVMVSWTGLAPWG